MPCYTPNIGYFGKDVNAATGKRGIVFSAGASFSGVPLRLPCGQCIGCRLEHSRQWAMRCTHEQQLHKFNSFVTLTYDDECLPEHGKLSRRDTQLFLKRLRDRRGRFRVYGCGEYGDTTNRPHYHMILFGLDWEDRKFYKKNKRGDNLYTSALLEDIWQGGQCVVGDATFESAAYCARYVVKKVTGVKAVEHYTKITEWGEVIDMPPEFPIMSRVPGIGRGWFDKFGADVYRHDSVVMRGMEMPPPRYYDGLYEIVDRDRLELLKRKRRHKAVRTVPDNTPERRRVREVVANARLALKGRS